MSTINHASYEIVVCFPRVQVYGGGYACEPVSEGPERPREWGLASAFTLTAAHRAEWEYIPLWLVVNGPRWRVTNSLVVSGA